MKHGGDFSKQNGATLVVGLIMLVAITMMMLSAFSLSGGNLKAAGNMQFRNEAIAAARIAIEQTININFWWEFINSMHITNRDCQNINSSFFHKINCHIRIGNHFR